MHRSTRSLTASTTPAGCRWSLRGRSSPRPKTDPGCTALRGRRPRLQPSAPSSWDFGALNIPHPVSRIAHHSAPPLSPLTSSALTTRPARFRTRFRNADPGKECSPSARGRGRRSTRHCPVSAARWSSVRGGSVRISPPSKPEWEVLSSSGEGFLHSIFALTGSLPQA